MNIEGIINKYFDHIYCLNLDRRIDRWKAMSKRFKKHGIQASRFPAVDGEAKENLDRFSSLVRKYGTKDKRLGHKTLRSPGALGCLLSYRKIIKRSKKRGYKRILIFEDDVYLSKSFNREFENIAKIRDDWKLLYLGASQYSWRGVKMMSKPFYRARVSQGTFAIAIDKSIFDEILTITKDVRIPIDSYLSFSIQKKYKNKCFVFCPNIAIADVSNSDIRRPIRDTRRHAKDMRWDLGRYDLDVE